MNQLPKQLVIIIVVCLFIITGSLAIIIFLFWEAQNARQIWKESKVAVGGVVVIADRHIEEGAKISADDIYEVKMDESNVPLNAVLCKRFALNKLLRFRTYPGKLLTAAQFLDEKTVLKEQRQAIEKRSSPQEHVCNHDVLYGSAKGKSLGVRAKEDIYLGTRIDQSLVEEVELEVEKIPASAFRNMSGVFVKVPTRDIAQGDIILLEDVVPANKSILFNASRDIEPGEILAEKDICQEKEIRPVAWPRSAILDKDSIIGKKVIRVIKKGQIIKAHLVE